MYFFNDCLKIVKLSLVPLALILFFLGLSRLALFTWQFERIYESGEIAFIFLQGIRFDLVLISMVMILPASLTPLFATHTSIFRYWRRFMLFYMTGWFIFIAFMELATPSFINQFDSRPNYLFVEYLEHYREVSSMLLTEYPLQLLFAAIALPLVSWVFYRMSSRLTQLNKAIRVIPALVMVPVLFVSFAFGARSTLDHRPVNPSTVALTTDHLVNELPLSSAYTVLFAIYRSSEDEKGGVPYGEMPFERVINIVRNEMNVDPSAFTDPDIPTRHKQKSSKPGDRPTNLVIVLQESLGAEFVGRLGGLPLTPNLDALANEGIWFENLYATGTRSARGIEAVITGFPPTPALSVIKQSKAQRDFFTLASFLKERGYDTGFIYGGEAHFDNMRGFFMSNGFNYVIDEKDYPDTAFMATWGASDEDLYIMADKKLSSYEDQPFFTLIFTSSNHSPFEFPDGRIELYDEKIYTVNNAVKYADYALGQFIKKAKQSDYWDNTLFLVIADHNSRVYGSSLVPIERFHIPGLILGGPVKKHEVIDTLASQIDIEPTLLSLMGISGEHPMVGRDLTLEKNRDDQGHAIMQFNNILAYMEGHEVAILQQELPPQLFQYVDQELVKINDARDIENNTLVQKALAYSLFAQRAYENKLYR